MEGTTTVRNKRTGETRVIKKSELQNYGIGVTPAPTATTTTTSTQPQMTTTQKISNLFNYLGLSAIPTIAGAGYEAQRGLRTALGEKGLYGNEETGQTIENPFLTEKRMQEITDKPLETIARQTAGLASYAAPQIAGSIIPGVATSVGGLVGRQAVTGALRGGLVTSGIPETTPKQIATGAAVGAIAEPLFNIAKTYSTFPKLSKFQQQVVSEYDAQGATGNWSNVIDKVKENSLYKSPAGKRAINKVIADYSPATLTGDITPSELYQTRGTITDVYGSKSLFGNIFAEPKSKLETKAAEVVRRAVSSELHSVAPKTEIADWFVTHYNKGGFFMKGDIPQKILKLGIAYGGYKGLRPLFQSIFYAGRGLD